MAYQVFENGKPCSSLCTEGMRENGWDKDTFQTEEEAKLFMILWAYPYSRETAKRLLPDYNFKEGQDYDLSMSEVTIMMSYRKVPDHA